MSWKSNSLTAVPFAQAAHSGSNFTLELIPKIQHEWDLVFIDADKENYSNYFDLIIAQVRPGGLIIADNVLWSGKVLEPTHKKDLETKSLKNFNEKVKSDTRVSNLLLPVRDGMMIMIKK